MSLVLCGRCHGEGEAITNYGWEVCPECHGEGYVDEYFEDEWYEEWEDYEAYWWTEPDDENPA